MTAVLDAPPRDGVARTGRYVWFPVSAPAPVPDPALVTGRRIVVLGGTAAERESVTAALAAAGAQAVRSTVGFSGGDASPSDDDLLARSMALVADLGGIDGIVDLGVAGGFSLGDPGPWRAALRDTVALLKATYEDWAGESDARRVSYLTVTRMGGRMGYDAEGVVQPLGGVWAGLAKSLPQELPNCRVKVVDLAADEEAGPRVVAELATLDTFEVGYRDGRRYGLAADARPVAPPQLTLKPGDTVLLSGGARGVGFELAWRLASEFGCEVVLTGRSEAPRGDEDWAGLDDDAFAGYEQDRYRAVGDGVSVREVRAELGRIRALRAVHHNLDRARRAGLPISYRRCDVTDASAVAHLLEAIGPRLRVVIHNAGVASPTRLRTKSLGSFVDTVATKVDGFIALAGALAGGDVAAVCNVGSVSGRLGGMIGQIDYAAANEALTRLGFWAGDLPVTTICWPTWRRLGLVANYAAALRYAAAIDIDEGVDHWVAELVAGGRGEVMYLGPIGSAITPSQLDGFQSFRGHPDLPRLASLRHYLGTVETFVPFRELHARSVVEGRQPVCGEFRVGGRAALSIGAVLEYARSLGDWVVPEGWPILWLHEIHDISVRLDGLVLRDGAVVLVKHGAGARTDDGWGVDVALSTPGTDEPVVSARLCYRDVPSHGPAPVQHAAAAAGVSVGGGGRLWWRWLAHAPAAWTREPDGRLHGNVCATPAKDLWTQPLCPDSVLPHAAVENIVAAVATGAPDATTLTIASLAVRDGAGPEATLHGSADRGTWDVRDPAGRQVAALEGVALR